MQGKQPDKIESKGGKPKLDADADMAQKRFELENEIIEEEALYHFDEGEVDRLFKERPWKKDEKHFKKVKISATALIKMVMHTKSGGDIEVMGMMQGKVKGDTFWIMDSFALPVEGTETRVNAGNEANEYMIGHIEDCEAVNRPENVVGWYHSHPGYACWLSGIDVNTEMLFQRGGYEPFVAIVIDPKRTMSAGKVEIGCFRTYSQAHIAQIEADMKGGDKSGGAAASVPMDKIQELGNHYYKYYELETSFFKSSLDNDMLARLWNEYWLATLSTSPLLTNASDCTNQVNDINQKIQQASKDSGNAMVKGGGFGGRRGQKGQRSKLSHMLREANDFGAGDQMMPLALSGAGGFGGSSSTGQGLSDKVMDQINKIEKESSKVACECDHGIMVEVLKKYMFQT